MKTRKAPGIVRRAPGPLALEQRFMFDGAAAATAAAEVLEPVQPQPAAVAEAQAGDSEAGATTLAPAAVATAAPVPPAEDEPEGAAQEGTAQSDEPEHAEAEAADGEDAGQAADEEAPADASEKSDEEEDQEAALGGDQDATALAQPLFVFGNASADDARVAEAAEIARLQVAAYLEGRSAQELFALFSGGQAQAGDEWLAAAEQLRLDIVEGRFTLNVRFVSNAALGGAYAAFAAEGPDGAPLVLVNGDWIRDGAYVEGIARALVEELGHAIDARLNASDTQGDEGEGFAAAVSGIEPTPVSQARIAAENDMAVVSLDGRDYMVEEAAFAFGNAYAVDTSVRKAEKEQNSVDFTFTPLSVARITDLSGGLNFSGNDVVVQLTVGGSTYYGWVSRPIKSGGQVMGFYFWTDDQFTTMAAATADGNTDSDANPADNRGFILVVNQNYFINTVAFKTGSTTVKNVGTSSDRVDSALNGLMVPNTPPSTVNDTAVVLEEGSVSGNVLTNDTDVNYDTLSVTSFTVGGTTYNVGTGSSNTATISGVGTLLVNSTGAYTFTPEANYQGVVPVITYTVSDTKGTSTATLSIAITPINDAPAGTDKTVTAYEDTAYTFSAADFGFTDPSDSPAHTLDAVKISSLPATGTLKYNGTAVTSAQITAGFYVLAADISKLTFEPAANSTGTTSFSFQVRDNGGTANGGINLDPTANTVTIQVTAVNDAPVASADTSPDARESGHNEAGINPSGNLLSNDTDVDDAGTALKVTAVSNAAAGTSASPAAGSTSALNAASVVGRYGTLLVGANGSYTYQVDNANSAVQALRQTSNTLSEQFTYTMSDAAGATSTSTLSILIQGTNDAPVATHDFASAKEHLTATPGIGSNAAGNVLDNDIDVDGNAESKTIFGLTATATGDTPATFTGTSFTLASVTGVAGSGGGGYKGDAVYRYDNATSTWVDSGMRVATVNSATNTITLSVANGFPAGTTLTVSNGESLQFYLTQNGNNNVIGTSAHATLAVNMTGAASPSTTLNVSSITDTILVGMAVSGTGITNGTTVTAYDRVNNKVTLSQNATVSNSAVTFTAAAGTTLTGKYGSLVLNVNGSYVYTASTDNASISEGQSGTDTFSYLVQDAAGITSKGVLTVQFMGSGSNDPDAKADTATAREAGGVNNGTAGINPSGNVLLGDAGGGVADSTPASTGSLSVVGARHGSVSAETSIGTGTAIIGQYGTLTISVDGAYTYTVDNGNATVRALRTNTETLTETFYYRVRNGAPTPREDVTTLTITIQGANDAPVAVADTHGATEAGGIGNATPGFNPSGNVLTNDTDSDAGDTKQVTSLVGGTVGTTLNSTYGSLLLNTDGSYTYTVLNNKAEVQALAAGQQVTDTFTYTVRDTDGLTSTSTLTITVTGANDAPVNSVPGSTVGVAEGASVAITGVSVADPEGNFGTVKLTVLNGTVNVSEVGAGKASISAGGNGTSTLTLTGTQLQINAALATLSYQGNSYFSGSDTLTIESTDAGGLRDIDTLAISVGADNRALTVNSVSVNEASPYAVFTVGGVAGQRVTLAVAGGGATAGVDFGTALQYLSGGSWLTYTGNPVTIPAGNSMLVRVAVLNDSAYEGAESFTLTATNTAGATATGTGTIKDDGTGNLYPDNTTGATGTGTLDDDRPVTVSSVDLNEASSHAVFTVGGAVGQVVSLSLADGNATSGADYGPSLQYWNGAWQNYTGPVTLTSTTLLVRTPIINNAVYEGPEAFGLRASNTGGTATVGNAVIYDDGTASKYDGTVTGSSPTPPVTTVLDNDLSVTVTAAGPVNEGSSYAVFTVVATAGETLTLALGTTAGSSATIAGMGMEYSTDGTTWTAYTWNAATDTGNRPVVPGITGSGTGTFYVRVGITSEADASYEGAETFTLTASTATGAGASAQATATIIDDGTGTKYPGTVTSGTPDGSTTGLDNDLSVAVTAAGPVNEASPYAMFTVTATVGEQLTLTLGNGAGASAAIAGFTTVQYSTDGSTWTTYTWNGTTGNRPTVPAGGKVYVRVGITSEA
ncbi:MAG TPA: VCBS domain-containing protein, partial [Ramlibacter sp.]|nr:VCBS domain-containing protein [Ramlibacter sp.]